LNLSLSNSVHLEVKRKKTSGMGRWYATFWKVLTAECARTDARCQQAAIDVIERSAKSARSDAASGCSETEDKGGSDEDLK